MTDIARLPEPVSARYAAAVRDALPLLAFSQLDILCVFMNAPQKTISAGEIARQLGIHHVTVSASLASIGMKVLELMGLEPIEAAKLFPRPWCIVAIEGQPGLSKGFPWELRREVVAELTRLGFPGLFRNETDEITAKAGLTEGALNTGWVETRQRNSEARAQCLDQHGSVCGVCEMDFGLIYGAEFRDCIHVHHLSPLAQATGSRPVDPNTDLIPVCPNCHAVIHAHGENRSIADVRNLIQSTCAKVK